jgi:hypothetical protein
VVLFATRTEGALQCSMPRNEQHFVAKSTPTGGQGRELLAAQELSEKKSEKLAY